MTNPTIKDAKEICTRYRKNGAVILTFDNRKFHCSSYGFTRSWCDAMRHVVEQIAGLIEEEAIEIPDSSLGRLSFDPIATTGDSEE